MIGRVLAAVKEAPDAPPIQDPKQVEELYRSYRNQVLYGSMVAYALFYFCRQNLKVASPLMGKQLGYTNEEIGQLGAWLYITYAVFKLVSGLLADRASPRVFTIGGLVASAIVCILFGLTGELGLSLPTALMVFVVLWGLNGIVQSTGAPASAKILATWFSVTERGTRTAIWNISHQAGGGLVLIVAGLFAHHWGWQGAMIGPALIALVGAVILARFLHDRPESKGLPPVEEHRNDRSAVEDDAKDVPFVSLVIWRVLLNPLVWLIGLGSCCTYIARYGPLDWLTKYLHDVRGYDVRTASLCTSLVEWLGIPGALLCGWLSDKLGARRAPVVMVSLVFLAAAIWGLYWVPPEQTWLIVLLSAAIGFFTYGPQMLLAGVAPVDMSSKRVAAAAVGFTGFASYAGATVQSRTSGWLIDLPGKGAGWQQAFEFWALAALVGAALCLPMWAMTPKKTAK